MFHRNISECHGSGFKHTLHLNHAGDFDAASNHTCDCDESSRIILTHPFPSSLYRRQLEDYSSKSYRSPPEVLSTEYNGHLLLRTIRIHIVCCYTRFWSLLVHPIALAITFVSISIHSIAFASTFISVENHFTIDRHRTQPPQQHHLALRYRKAVGDTQTRYEAFLVSVTSDASLRRINDLSKSDILLVANMK